MIHAHAVVVRNIKSAAANEYNAPRPRQILVTLFLSAQCMMIAWYMGVKNADGSACCIVGLRNGIRAKIGKQAGDAVKVIIKERM